MSSNNIYNLKKNYGLPQNQYIIQLYHLHIIIIILIIYEFEYIISST